MISFTHNRIFKDEEPTFSFNVKKDFGEDHGVFAGVDSKGRPFFGGGFKF